VPTTEIPVETEIKLRYDSPEGARNALVGIGATLERSRHFEENMLLDHADMRMRIVGSLLRIRETEGAGVLTFKGPRRVVGGIKSREEVESQVSDPKALLYILERLGLRPSFRYQKYREVYSWKGLELVIDETPIGTFVEIEGEVDGIREAATALGRSADDYIADSYIALYTASGGTGDMVFA
jgi:adenylate cyclase class 2